ncbi:MAG: cation:proton antiporter [Phycisphaeraceae bacterium]|nr:cation:proton antiporter [Phycisphaeraceae bacterium]
MIELLTIVVAAAAAVGVARRLRLPAVPVFVIAGLLLGLSGLLGERGALGTETIRGDVITLGLAFLLFAAGLELDPSRVGGQRRAAMVIGCSQFIAILLLGFGAAVLFRMELTAAMHIALMLAASSTIIGVQLLAQRRQLYESLGRLVLGVLLLQDLLMVVAIGVLSGAAGGPLAPLRATTATVLLLILAFVVIRVASPRIFVRLNLDQETLLLAALAILFGFCGLAWWIGLPITVGAFLAGVSLSSFPTGPSIRKPIGSVASFFTAVFFVALGSLLTLPPLSGVWQGAVFVAIVLIGTPVVVVIASLHMDLPRRTAIEAGLLLAQAGELAIVVALFGFGRGVIDEPLLAGLMFVTVGTMVLTPILATEENAWRILRLLPVRIPALPRHEGHALLLGCSGNSRVLLDLLMLSGMDVIVIDEDPAVVARLRERGVAAIRGDASDPRVLEAASARDARLVISTLRRTLANERLLRCVPPERVTFRVFEENDVVRLRAAGATVVSEAEAAAAETITLLQEAGRIGAAGRPDRP